MQHCLSSPHSLTATTGQLSPAPVLSSAVSALYSLVSIPSSRQNIDKANYMLQLPGAGRGGLVTDRAGCKDDNCLTFWLHLVSTSSAPAQPPVTAFIQVGNFKLLLNCNLDPLAGVGASIVPGPASAAICLLSCRCRGPWGRGEQICENCSEGGRTPGHNSSIYHKVFTITEKASKCPY